MLNKVQLIGRLGKDPEVRYTTEGDAVANVTLATTESWKDKTGSKTEKTEWHNLVFFRRQAEVVGEYLRKGALIYVEGKIVTEKYEKNGEDRYISKIVVSEMKMLGGKPVEDDHHAEPVTRGNKGTGKAAKHAKPEPY